MYEFNTTGHKQAHPFYMRHTKSMWLVFDLDLLVLQLITWKFCLKLFYHYYLIIYMISLRPPLCNGH